MKKASAAWADSSVVAGVRVSSASRALSIGGPTIIPTASAMPHCSARLAVRQDTNSGPTSPSTFKPSSFARSFSSCGAPRKRTGGASPLGSIGSGSSGR